MFQIGVISINCSKCPNLFPSYRNHCLLLRRERNSHSLCWGRKSSLRLWRCPSVRPHRRHSSRWRRGRSCHTGRARAGESRCNLPKGGHSSWCPAAGERCGSPRCMKAAEQDSNCSRRSQREWTMDQMDHRPKCKTSNNRVSTKHIRKSLWTGIRQKCLDMMHKIIEDNKNIYLLPYNSVNIRRNFKGGPKTSVQAVSTIW